MHAGPAVASAMRSGAMITSAYRAFIGSTNAPVEARLRACNTVIY
jgi:hypothetical protein